MQTHSKHLTVFSGGSIEYIAAVIAMACAVADVAAGHEYLATEIAAALNKWRIPVEVEQLLKKAKMEPGVLRHETCSHACAGDHWGSVRFSCLLYTSPSPRDLSTSRMPSSA